MQVPAVSIPWRMMVAGAALSTLLIACSHHRPVAPPPPPDWREWTFPSEWTASGNAPLTDGEYREPAAPGSATQVVVRLTAWSATGMMENRETTALVIVTDPGGSGTFYELVVLQAQPGGWQLAGTTRLGDRIRLRSMLIADNEIRLQATTHGPDDPRCCPTQPETMRFRLDGDRLIRADSW